MLHTVVIVDYQNVHMTARDVFCPGQSPHLALIHPMQFGRALLRRRNERLRYGEEAELAKVLVYRGLPHVNYDSAQHGRCVAQASQWRSDGAEVHLRDLKYPLHRDADGRPIVDVHGKKTPSGPGKEKGIDVLCALACVREAISPETDLVVLASRDTDLIPALDEVYDMRSRHPSGREDRDGRLGRPVGSTPDGAPPCHRAAKALEHQPRSGDLRSVAGSQQLLVAVTY